MKNSQAKNKAVANRRRSTDAQVAEFDRKDFGADVRRA